MTVNLLDETDETYMNAFEITGMETKQSKCTVKNVNRASHDRKSYDAQGLFVFR